MHAIVYLCERLLARFVAPLFSARAKERLGMGVAISLLLVTIVIPWVSVVAARWRRRRPPSSIRSGGAAPKVDHG